ncbi:MAG: metallophosphoesterase [Erysipelotrichaceae bacterium]|nr:metallophosphoesterase [Erysipelotrichaceae bacterium]
MDVSVETYEQYHYALRAGKKNVRRRKRENRNIHPEVLDNIVNVYDCSQERLGQIDVPASLIVGTKTAARTLAFSSDFMPILKDSTEFASKWREVCRYHLSDTGITEAPTAYEYLGKFYVEEGNKRVSVLKSYGAYQITLDVIRLLPPRSNKSAIIRYYEFLDFYKLSRLYTVQFSRNNQYQKFQKLMGFEEDHVWTRLERINLAGFFGRLESHLQKYKITYNHSDCLVALMEIFGYENLVKMTDKELDKVISINRYRLIYGHGLYKIICIADEEDMALYSEHAQKELKDIDFIISCGDLKAEYLEFLVTVSNKPLYYVKGNHDDRYETNPPEGCICIDDDIVEHQGLKILGLGGSIRYSQAKYQYTELQMERRIRKLRRKIRQAGNIDIVVTHAPIKGYGDLADYAHQGFECFEKLLLDLHPRYWLFGHVHLSYQHRLQRVIEHKDTKIINCCGKYRIEF